MERDNDVWGEINQEIEEYDPLRIHVRLKEILKEKGISQKELAKMTDIRPAAISELANNLRTTINREHIEKIAHVLGIERLDELITFELESELWTMGNRREQQVYLDDNSTKD